MLSLESLEGGCSASSRNRFHVSLLVSIFRLHKVAATNLGSPARDFGSEFSRISQRSTMSGWGLERESEKLELIAETYLGL